MKRNLLLSFISLVFLFSIHSIVVYYTSLSLSFSPFYYYAVVALGTIGVIMASLFWYDRKPEQLNVGFLYGSVVKMIAIMSFVSIQLDLVEKMDKMQCALLYLGSLFIELFFIIRVLNKDSDRK